MIEVEQLTKDYGAVQALRGISFDVPRGQVLGFLGPNGAGKSTTIKILTTFVRPTSGKAWIAGFPVMDEAIEVRRRVGYLPEHAPLYLDMTVYDYLKYAARAREFDSYAEMRRAIARVVSIATLYEVAGRPISQLSKGFRQRVGLAQAMIHDPEVLILDEPTSGLDPIQITEIRKVIRRLGEERTVIFSTHIIPEVELTSDRVVVIDKGRIVADGAPTELRKAVRGRQFSLRWSGDEGEVKERIGKSLGDSAKVLETNRVGDSYEVKLKVAGDAVAAGSELDRLAGALSGDGKLTDLRHDMVSLEEAFFELVGRRSES